MAQNILLITCDQYRYPRFYPTGGLAPALEKVLGFLELDEGNEYIQFFPGLMRLRKNAVLLANHTIAASACIPSRATIYTGQYGTRTGVTQTDGLFKSGDSPQYPWLKADGIPTLGSWMRAGGYTTHYFGKWHISNPPGHTLQQYGFDNWEESYPEPHGSQANNLGLYRDVGFTDAACSFLRRRALGLNYNRVVNNAAVADPNAKPPPPEDKPWFAVLSLTNPHDIATYPGVVSQALPGTTAAGTQSPLGPVTMPAVGERSVPPTGGAMTLPLNPGDFPTNAATHPPNFNEDLSNKPSCQKDYAYKFGLALASKLGFNIASGADAAGNPLPLDVGAGVAATLASSIPFQLWSDPIQSIDTFIQLYAWLHSVVDPHIDRVLQALEDSGQAENTIVMFLCDHGEYAGAHGGMMEKWHTAYQEALHVPVVVRFPEATGAPVLAGIPTPRSVAALTSHIDILPTILGLAGVDEQTAWQALCAQRGPVPQPVGVNLTPLILGQTRRVVERDQTERKGVLFITDDEITAPLSYNPDPHTQRSYEEYGLYDAVVDTVRVQNPGLGLTEGATVQPNHVRCVRTQRYKLARYFDPSRQVKEEWEMYDLEHDRLEETNLVQVNVSPPTSISSLPSWTSVTTVNAAARELLQLLDELEARCLPVVTEQTYTPQASR